MCIITWCKHGWGLHFSAFHLPMLWLSSSGLKYKENLIGWAWTSLTLVHSMSSFLTNIICHCSLRSTMKVTLTLHTFAASEVICTSLYKTLCTTSVCIYAHTLTVIPYTIKCLSVPANNSVSHRLASLYSPPKATTVLIEESTSSATAPADAYSFCSRLAKATVNCKSIQRMIMFLN